MSLRWLVASLLWLIAPAAAHLMPAGHGTVNVVGQKAYVVLALPVRAFQDSGAAAAVKDGVLTAQEFAAHQGALQGAVRAGLTIKVDGQPATLGRVLLNQAKPSPGHAHPHAGAELTAMVVVHLPAKLGVLAVNSRLWATDRDTLKLEVTRTEGERITRREVHTLTPRAQGHHFFVAPASAPAPHAHGRSDPAHGSDRHPH